jgi:hypothetical protein
MLGTQDILQNMTGMSEDVLSRPVSCDDSHGDHYHDHDDDDDGVIVES